MSFELCPSRFPVWRRGSFGVEIGREVLRSCNAQWGHMENAMKLKDIRFRYKEHVLTLTVYESEAFLIGDIFIKNEYAFTQLKGVISRPVVVDIGANVGLFALYAHLNLPNATIHCFEPSPTIANVLEKNLAAYGNITIHTMALSDRDEAGTLFLNTRKCGQSTIKTDPGGGSEGWEAEPVNVLDAYSALTNLGLERIDILKIDTEGSEVEILRSITPMLDDVKHIYLEYHSAADLKEVQRLTSRFVVLHSEARGDGVGVVHLAHKRLYGA